MDRLERAANAFFSPVFLARVFFVLVTTWCGMLLAQPDKPILVLGIEGFETTERILYSIVAFLAAVVLTLTEYATSAISSHKILMAAVGSMFGLVFASLFYPTIPEDLADPVAAHMVCNLFFGYFGMILAIKHAERFHLRRLKALLGQEHDKPKVLDSSVIIDGRIRELITLQVVRGSVLVPEFVIAEIQAIADSSDPNRKARGRRGLDVLEALREICRTLELIDNDYPEIAGVDQKLVFLCRDLNADLITNDYNLQKIGQVHGLTVINLNEMANALRPTVYIGETFFLTIVREGKEPGQGVGYLEDGTMVVVDDARSLLNQEIEVIVSSILQTSSGRLVFSRPLQGTAEEAGHRKSSERASAEGGASSSRSRARAL